MSHKSATQKQQQPPAAPNEASPDPYSIKQELIEAPRPVAGKHSNIVEFYSNRSVLITGASGFIGKVLIEKLIRTCPSIRRIFVLIRPKWNKKPEERLEQLLAAPLFDGVRDQKLDERVVLVEGDVTQPNLGLNGNNLSRIIKEVSVIFHSAATVKFDEPLKQSVAINIAGTKNMIEICRRIPQLAALVHVSTAYANCDRSVIDEYIYPMEMDPEKLIQMADWLDSETLQELKRRLLAARPNTYTYTKALAEWLLVRSARDLPVVICRPSIVIASHREPVRGWIDNVNGPTGVILGTGKGLIRSMYAENNYKADLVPVDMVINLVVTLGWFAYINRGQQKHLHEAAESSFEDSILGGRSASPTASGCSSSSAASVSGDEPFDPEQQQDPIIINSNNNGDKQKTMNNNNQQQKLDPQVTRQQTSNNGAQVNCLPMLDDGYGSSRNSVASSDAASTSSSSSSSIRKTHHNHHHHHHSKHRQTRPTVKISCSAIVEQQQQHDLIDDDDLMTSSAPEDSSKLINSSEGHVDGSAGPDEEQLQCKLKQFRQRTRAKLVEQQLPIELAEVPVFHCTSGCENPVTWGQIQVLILTALSIYPSTTTYRYPCGSFTNNKTLDDFYRWTLHYIPGYIADFVTKLCGGKPIIVRIFNKFDQAAAVLRAFTSHQWDFKCDNRLFLLEELMNEEDRRLFNIDIRTVDWKVLLHDYILGVRKFMLKEPMDNLEQARSNLKMTYYRNLSLQILFMATLTYYMTSAFSGLLY